jgi:branched-chain amino acid transport system substrate-binding protein
MRRAEALALEEINAAGGINGRPLKIIWEDTQSKADQGMKAVRKLVEKHQAPLIIGAYSSGVSLPTGQWTNSQKVIQISVASTAPELRQIGPYFFNVIGLDEVMGIKLAEFALESEAQTYASIVVDNPFGLGIETWTEKTIKKSGKQWLEAVRYKENQDDYKPLIERFFAKRPEAVFFTAYGTDAKRILEQAHKMGLKPAKGWYADYMTMWYYEAVPETVEGIKGLVVGRHRGSRFKHYQDAYWQKYGAVYQKMYQRPVMQTAFGAYAYDATWIAALALKTAGSPDTDEIAKALHIVSKDYNGATGDKSFDQDGMQVMDYYQRMVCKDRRLMPYK